MKGLLSPRRKAPAQEDLPAYPDQHRGDGGLTKWEFLRHLRRYPKVSHAEFRDVSGLIEFADSENNEAKGKLILGNCFPSLKTVAKETGRSPKLIRKSFWSLERKGCLRRHRMRSSKGSYTTTLYQFLLPEGAEGGPWAGPIWWTNRPRGTIHPPAERAWGKALRKPGRSEGDPSPESQNSTLARVPKQYPGPEYQNSTHKTPPEKTQAVDSRPSPPNPPSPVARRRGLADAAPVASTSEKGTDGEEAGREKKQRVRVAQPSNRNQVPPGFLDGVEIVE